MKKICLEKIKQEYSNNSLRVSFLLRIGGRTIELWYKIYGEKKIRVIPELFDPIAVTFLWYALRNGYSFCSKRYPISERLMYQLQYQIIPNLVRTNQGIAKNVEVDVPICKDELVKKADFVATGVSCGVDSMTTICEYSEQCKMDNYKLTHLMYFKVGAHDGQMGRYDKDVEDKLFNEQNEIARHFSDKIGIPMITVDSNLNEVLSNCFGFVDYDRTHTYRGCGVMMMLQNYFSKYYYADTYGLDNFSSNLDGDCAHYEKWLLPLFSTNRISFYSANQGMSRFEKTQFIATNYAPSYDSLLVCWMSGKNCGICDKCIRTLVTLDLLGKMELYKNSFDVDNYLKDKRSIIRRVVCSRSYDPFFADIYSHMSLSMAEKFWINVGCIVKKIKNKIHRF